MKKILLTLNLILCVIAFAQNNTYKLKNYLAKRQGYFVQQNKNNLRLTQGNKVQQTQSTSLLDSTHFWSLDTTTQTWKLNYKSIAYTYDAQNRNTGYLGQQLNGSVWVNSELVTITYNTNTKTELTQTWDAVNHVWLNSTQYTYTYDANNNLLSELIQRWTNNAWVNSHLSTYNYNSLNEIIYELDQNWNNNAWYNGFRAIDHYNINGILTDWSQTYWDYNTHLINDSTLNTNTISFNNIASTTTSTWDFSTNRYDTLFRYIYTYDTHHNQISAKEQDPSSYWNGSSMVNDWATTDSSVKAYNASNLVLNEVSYSWTNNAWFKHAILLYSYDGAGNSLGWSSKSRYGTSKWQGDSTYNYYSTVTGITKLVDNASLITIYPNPSKGNLTIETNLQLQSLRIYDVKGSLVFEQKISNKTNIDISFLEDGVYNIALENNQSVINKKLIIVK